MLEHSTYFFEFLSAIFYMCFGGGEIADLKLDYLKL